MPHERTELEYRRDWQACLVPRAVKQYFASSVYLLKVILSVQVGQNSTCIIIWAWKALSHKLMTTFFLIRTEKCPFVAIFQPSIAKQTIRHWIYSYSRVCKYVPINLTIDRTCIFTGVSSFHSASHRTSHILPLNFHNTSALHKACNLLHYIALIYGELLQFYLSKHIHYIYSTPE